MENATDILNKAVTKEATKDKKPINAETENDGDTNNENESKFEGNDESSDNDDETNSKTESEPTNDDWDDLLSSGALLKKILVNGKENTKPQRLDICTVNFKCTLENGTEVESGENFTVQLSDLEVIQGLDLAITLMNIGEKCLVRIEPRLAYGSQGLDTRVPPDTSVDYEIELLKIEQEDEIENLTITQRKQIGDKKKKRGNWWYIRGECTFAIQCYRRALEYLDEVEGGITDPLPEDDDPKQREVTDAALQDLMEDRINVSNNMAAAQMKLGAFDAALQSLQIVLRCQPNNVKALYRKAKVLKAKNEIPEALKCLQKAKLLEPDNSIVQKEIIEINVLLKKHKNYEKELAKRMVNGASPKTDSNTRIPTQSPPSYMWASVALSVAVGLAGVVAWRFKFS